MTPKEAELYLRQQAPDPFHPLSQAADQLGVLIRASGWLAGEDTGASSQAIAAHMLGLPSDGAYPHDPADLGRCLRLLRLVPEWETRIQEMARYGKAWELLLAQWSFLAGSMAAEVGFDWERGRKAPKTYALMKRILAPAWNSEGVLHASDDV
jgi:hypothetical protein